MVAFAITALIFVAVGGLSLVPAAILLVARLLGLIGMGLFAVICFVVAAVRWPGKLFAKGDAHASQPQ